MPTHHERPMSPEELDMYFGPGTAKAAKRSDKRATKRARKRQHWWSRGR